MKVIPPAGKPAVRGPFAAAQANGATVHVNTPIDSITETADRVVTTSGEKSC